MLYSKFSYHSKVSLFNYFKKQYETQQVQEISSEYVLDKVLINSNQVQISVTIDLKFIRKLKIKVFITEKIKNKLEVKFENKKIFGLTLTFLILTSLLSGLLTGYIFGGIEIIICLLFFFGIKNTVKKHIHNVLDKLDAEQLSKVRW